MKGKEAIGASWHLSRSLELAAAEVDHELPVRPGIPGKSLGQVNSDFDFHTCATCMDDDAPKS